MTVPEPMGIHRGDFADRLVQCCREWGIVLSHEQVMQLVEHVQLMLLWNRRINLTRITSSRSILAKHIMDSLIPLRWIKSARYALDVGTGAGYPAIPAKILWPWTQWVFIEASRRKASFLRTVVAHLALKDVDVVHARWEEWAGIEMTSFQDGIDLMTLRAVRLEDRLWTRLAAKVLRPGGVLAFWAGVSATPRKSLPFDPMVFGYSLPFHAGSRCLCLYRKEAVGCEPG